MLPIIFRFDGQHRRQHRCYAILLSSKAKRVRDAPIKAYGIENVTEF